MTEILIIGAGYAGLRVLKELKHESDIHITIVDKNDYHYQTTQLAEVAAGNTTAKHISFAISSVLPDNATFVQDEVTKIDRDNKQVEVKSGAPLKYDYLVASLGFVSETFGIKGADINALEMDTLNSAAFIDSHIKERIRNYLSFKNPHDLSFIVCGAGFTGIELTGELLDAFDHYSKKYNIDRNLFTLRTVEAAPTILPMFDASLAQYAARRLSERGAIIDADERILEVLENEVVTDKKRLKANTIIWTTGVSGSNVIKESGFDAKRNRVTVTPELTVPEHPDMFVIGDDSASFAQGAKGPYPTTAQLAIAQATVAAKNIKASIKGSALTPFVYKSVGTVCSLGDNDSIAQLGERKTKFKGHIASIIKKASSDNALLEVSNWKTLFEHGRFDLYH